jgi:hypothetical protein
MLFPDILKIRDALFRVKDASGRAFLPPLAERS